jgi:uncharacterized repeat protein (TIGR03837 family)
MKWDIFCTVIDNFGDIGITWRLSRQLAAEHHIAVRLWVDDLEAFQKIRPEINPILDRQSLAGVEIRRWTTPFSNFDAEDRVGDVVIEALACNLPEPFIQLMATAQPVWLNLEYLTAEDWAPGVHGLPSPHPRWPLTKYFFVPGFVPETGGLIRENTLISTRKAFQDDARQQAAQRSISFWPLINVAQPDMRSTPSEIQISLFSYSNRALPALLNTWANGLQPVRVFVPQGKALPDIAAWLAGDQAPALPAAGTTLQRGALTLHVLPMLDQDAYDQLLWLCDLNFVRGEDSFVRAQYAGLPMVWQAYPQEEAAHLQKLAAFLDLYCAALSPPMANLIRTLWHGWNTEMTDTDAWQTGWQNWLDQLPALRLHARNWAAHLAAMPDLAANLMIFCEKLRKNDNESDTENDRMPGFSDSPSGNPQ